MVSTKQKATFGNGSPKSFGNLIDQEQNNWIWLAVLFVPGMVVFSVNQKPFGQYAAFWFSLHDEGRGEVIPETVVTDTVVQGSYQRLEGQCQWVGRWNKDEGTIARGGHTRAIFIVPGTVVSASESSAQAVLFVMFDMIAEICQTRDELPVQTLYLHAQTQLHKPWPEWSSQKRGKWSCLSLCSRLPY